MMQKIYIYFLFSLLCANSVYSRQSHSQFGQDEFVYDAFFKNKKKGIFVDIGAHDGVTISNSLMYEQMGWHGICIEPMPDIFAQLKKNRTCICIKGCVSDKPGIKKFLRVHSPRVSTEMLSGLLEKYDPDHLLRVDRELAQYGGTKEIIKVRCYTFNKLMRKHNITHIDYLSIDTEGGELDILKSINFDAIKIYVIDVENNKREQDTSIKEFLESKGFAFVQRIKCDEIYCNSQWKQS